MERLNQVQGNVAGAFVYICVWWYKDIYQQTERTSRYVKFGFWQAFSSMVRSSSFLGQSKSCRQAQGFVESGGGPTNGFVMTHNDKSLSSVYGIYIKANANDDWCLMIIEWIENWAFNKDEIAHRDRNFQVTFLKAHRMPSSIFHLSCFFKLLTPWHLHWVLAPQSPMTEEFCCLLNQLTSTVLLSSHATHVK